MTYRTFETIWGDTVYLNKAEVFYIVQHNEVTDDGAAGVVFITENISYSVDKYQLAYVLGKEFSGCSCDKE